MWKRESADEPRWSPMTHSRPSGTSTPSAPGRARALTGAGRAEHHAVVLEDVRLVELDGRGGALGLDGHVTVGAAGDPVAGDADDALDEVLLTRGADADGAADGAQHALHAVGRRRDLVLGGEGVQAVEDDDLAAVDVAEVVDELVHQHPVAQLERLLHRAGRDVEGLHEEGLDEQGQQERDDDEEGQLLEERAALRRVLRASGVVPSPPPSVTGEDVSLLITPT